MPKLWKDIIPEGSFLVSTPKGRLRRKFVKEELEQIAGDTNVMLQSGLKVPAPFDHVAAAVPILVNEKAPNSYNNGGYYEQFVVAEKDGQPILRGLVDCPGSEDDPQSPYYKALHTNKEVSVNLRDEYTDGLGRVWRNVIGHVAFTNFPVVPGQNGFEKPAEGMIVNMSMMDPDDTLASDLLPKVRDVLKRAVKIIIPDGITDVTEFLKALHVAGCQLAENQPIDGQVLEPVPIYMSTSEATMDLAQANAIVATKAINPATQKPFTLEDLGFKPAPPPQQVNMSTEIEALKTQLAEKDSKLAQASSIVKAMAASFQKSAKAEILRRVEALKKIGLITDDIFKTAIEPKLEYNMSIDPTTGEFASHPLDITLSTMEHLASTMRLPGVGQQQPVHDPLFGGTIMSNPLDVSSGQLTAEQMEASFQELCSFVE